MQYIKFTSKELEATRYNLWREDYLPILYKFLELKDRKTALDVGCGSGFFTRIIASGMDGKVTGVDLDEDLLKEARESNGKIEYFNRNIYNLDFFDDNFDIVTAHMVLCNLTDPKKAIMEMKRVSKDLVVVIEPCNSAGIRYYGDDKELVEFGNLLDKARKGYDRLVEEKGIDMDIGKKLPSLFFECGLRNIEVEGYLMINFSGKSDSSRLSFELGKLKECVPKYLTEEEFERIKSLMKNKRKDFYGAISAVPLFMVKGRKYG
jgi:SAM-dependent methyltransferase